MSQAEQLRPTDQATGIHGPWPVVDGAAAPPAWLAALSGRDVEVLRRLAEGESTADIAQQLAYSESTIKNVIHDVVRQLGARNRAQAVAMGIRAGII